MELLLKDRTALVTGASAGIGRAIALELGREGVRMAVTGRRRPELETLADEVAAMGTARPAIVIHDALAPDYVEAVASQATAALGAVQILVNNAGGSRAFGRQAGPPTSDAGSAFRSASVRPYVASSSVGSPCRGEPRGSSDAARWPYRRIESARLTRPT